MRRPLLPLFCDRLPDCGRDLLGPPPDVNLGVGGDTEVECADSTGQREVSELLGPHLGRSLKESGALGGEGTADVEPSSDVRWLAAGILGRRVDGLVHPAQVVETGVAEGWNPTIG